MLATGMEPSVNVADINVAGDNSGFIQLDESNGGIFAAGSSSEALDVNRSVQSATASVLRSIQVINNTARVER